jgi:hypothetical protein
MKKFLINILYFSSPILLTGYLFDIFISTNLKKSNSFAAGEYPVWNDIMEGKVNSDILIYGSSTAWVHFNPEIISKKLKTSTYNLGIDGHNFWLQNLRHKQLIKFNKKPKLIIYAVDLITLQQNTELYNYEQFFPYMLWNHDFKSTIIGSNDFRNFEFSIPLLRYVGRYNSVKTAFEMVIFPENNPVERIKGYKGQNKLWNNDLATAEKKMGNFKVVLDPTVITKFETFLEECKSEKIKVIFVYTPEYTEGQKFIKNKNEIIKLYNDLSKKHSIPFYDFSNDKICLDKNYFYNTKHMNKCGASLFSNQISDTIIKYGYK